MRPTNVLTDAMITAAAAGGILTDGNGLRLRVTAPGAGAWQLKFRPPGSKEGTTKTLGNYPEPLSINKARAMAEDVRKAAAATLPISATVRKPNQAAITFGAVGEEYMAFARGRDNRAPSGATLVKRRWGFDKLSRLHSRPLTSITREDLLPLLKALQAEGRSQAAHYTARLASNIFDHAQSHGIDYNPAARRKHWLTAYRPEHHAAIVDAKRFGVLAGMVDGFSQGTVGNATRLLMRTAVRQGELRAAQWDEFLDLDNPARARWEIPAERMKMKQAFIVPLSPQAVSVLKAQAAISPQRAGRFVFPNARTPGECICKSAVQCHLEACGYEKSEHVPHGFRSSFATLAREAGKEDMVIELCMAHADRNKVRDSYNRAVRMEARRELMNWWSEHIEELIAAV